MPKRIPDMADFPLAADLPVTSALPVGSHVSIPILRDDGSDGSFRCMSPEPDTSLNDRDLSVMETFANLDAEQINGARFRAVERDRIVERTRRVIDHAEFTMAFQSIFALGRSRPGGYEALARFHAEPYRTPNVWFDEADSVGMGQSDAACLTALGRVRSRGVQLAIDDAGAGYSGPSQIAKLSPDVIKLDRSLVTGIDTHKARYSLAAAMVHFARETHAKLVAEGIGTQAEYDTLLSLGVERGQGYVLGKPAPLEIALKSGASPRRERSPRTSFRRPALPAWLAGRKRSGRA